MAISASKIYYCIKKKSLKDALLFKKVISNRTCIILVFKLIVLLINIIFEGTLFSRDWLACCLDPRTKRYKLPTDSYTTNLLLLLL